VRYISLNDYDIEDLIQQAALNLLRKGENLGGIKNLTSYVFRALENGAKDHFKKRSRETLTAEQEDEASAALEEKVLARELKDALARAVGRLEPNQRYVFIETEIKGRSYDDLARETGEKVGTLLSRKSRAVQKLKEMISDYIHEGGEHESK
jgi:RNA polymerase sigma factor (sigma-70 family)